jgi:hypothetical protein
MTELGFIRTEERGRATRYVMARPEFNRAHGIRKGKSRFLVVDLVVVLVVDSAGISSEPASSLYDI